jgi:hypothetical protein
MGRKGVKAEGPRCMVHLSIFGCPMLTALEPAATVLWGYMIVYGKGVDGEGRMFNDPAWLAANAFPNVRWRPPLPKIRAWLDVFEEAEAIVRYTDEGGRATIQCVNVERYNDMTKTKEGKSPFGPPPLTATTYWGDDAKESRQQSGKNPPNNPANNPGRIRPTIRQQSGEQSRNNAPLREEKRKEVRFKREEEKGREGAREDAPNWSDGLRNRTLAGLVEGFTDEEKARVYKIAPENMDGRIHKARAIIIERIRAQHASEAQS